MNPKNDRDMEAVKKSVLEAVTSLGEHAMPLIQSWERSQRRFGSPTAISAVPHAPEEKLDNTIFELSRDRLWRFARDLHGSGQGILLADMSGQILSAWSTDPESETHLRAVDTERGSDLSEAAMGTNGVGTVVAVGRGMRIYGPQHYSEMYSDALCIGEPILHPCTGDVLGAVVLSGPSREKTGKELPVLRETVATIQQDILRVIESGGELPALLIPDSWRQDPDNGLLIEGSARSLGEPASSTRSTAVPLAPELFPFPEVIVRDPVWNSLRGQLMSALRAGRVVSVVGEPGVGKSSLAQEALALHHRDRNIERLDAVRVGVDGWETFRRHFSQVLESGSALVVQHGDLLSDHRYRELHSLSESVSEGGSVVIAETRDAVSSVQRRLHPAPSVFIPALREYPERIIPTWKALAGPSYALLGPDVAELLRTHDWTGNYRELRHVIAQTQAEVTGNVVNIEALPSTLRKLPTGMSTIERVELQAIRQALTQAEGNRSRAAEILGISRATLYRKIKTFKIDL